MSPKYVLQFIYSLALINITRLLTFYLSYCKFDASSTESVCFVLNVIPNGMFNKSI